MTATTAAPAARATVPGPTGIDQELVTARVRGILNRHPCVGLAIGVVNGGRLEFFSGHGRATIESGAPITEDTVFRIASITKTFTAIALVQLWEEGRVDLDAPVNQYLRAFQLVPAKPAWRPATLRHLLTHTSGLPEMVHLAHAARYMFGESYALDEELPTLGEYYRGGLLLVSEPGSAFRYTDHSFATVGQVVEDVSGVPFAKYLREHILEPLGMTSTDILRTERVIARLATGYTLARGGPRPVTDRQWVTAAASSIYSSPRDMARYVAALLGGGANEHGRILQPQSLAMMFQPHFQTHPLIPGIGLAFDRYSAGPHAFAGHEGILPGFNSQILFAPDDGVGVLAFTNGASGAMFWLPAECSGLLGRLVGASEDVIRDDVPQRPETWSDICGWYKPSARLVDTRLRAFMGLGAEVFVRGDQLMIRGLNPIPALYRGFALHPDDDADPYVFRVDASRWGFPGARIIFSRDATGTMQVHLDLMPISLTRQRAATNPRLWATGAVAGVAAGIAVARLRSAGRRAG